MLEGSVDGATPAAPVSSVSSSSTSDVVLSSPSTEPDAKSSSPAMIQFLPSLQSPAQLSSGDQSEDAEENAAKPETEAQGASLLDRMSSSPSAASRPQSTEAESSSQPRYAEDNITVSATVSEYLQI